MIHRTGKHYLWASGRVDTGLRSRRWGNLRFRGLGVSWSLDDIRRDSGLGRPYRKRHLRLDLFASPEGTGGRGLSINFHGKQRPQ